MNIATIFSGIGAPEQALKELAINHKVVLACEIDKHARNTYLANHSMPDCFYKDVYDIAPDNCPDFDLLIFGFPCQSYSMMGRHRKGLEDNRGKLLYPVLDILKIKQPRYFIAENVRGLMMHDKGATFQAVLSMFKECGYDVSYKLLNTRSFGIPHNRERVFFVGFRKDLQESTFSFPAPITLTSIMRDYLEPNPAPHYYIKPAQKLTFNKRALNPVTRCFCHIDTPFAYCLTAQGARNRNLVTPDFRYAGVRIPILEPDTPVRRLTVRECARLQGFADSFIFPVTENQAFQQLGNTITVPVIKEIFRQLLCCKVPELLAAA